MAMIRGSHPFFRVSNQPVPNQKIWLFACISAFFLLPGLSASQPPAQPINQLPDAPVPQLVADSAGPGGQTPGGAADSPATITIPAGVRLELVLTHPVDSHSKTAGDEIFAQTSAPVIAGDEVVIPAGTFVRGRVEKLTRNGTRAEMLMQSATLVLANGYIVQAGGPVNIESEEWTAWNNPSAGARAAIILAPVLGAGAGLGIGAATDKARTLGGGTVGFPGGPMVQAPSLTFNDHRNLGIGGAVGGGVGLIVALAVAAHNRHFYVQEGSPMMMALPEAIALPRAQVNQANQEAAAHPAPVPVRPAYPPGVFLPNTGDGTCYLPGSPGTPGTHIPGTPGVNGMPGTPDVDIPGTPPSPPIPYPCP